MVDAAWLTAALARAGVLTDGEVASVVAQAGDSFNSATTFVAVTYRGVDAGLPERLVVKRPSAAAWSHAAAVQEAMFYRVAAARPDHPPVVARCLAAADDYLVLEDLSDTHVPPVSRAATVALRGVPSRSALEAAVDALATLHSHWWQPDPGPFEVAPWWRDDAAFDAYAGRRRRAWSMVRPQVPADLTATYDFLFERLPRFHMQTLRPRRDGPLTLIHGDAYLSNFLVPRSGHGGAVLLDWQSPSVDIGALDLANMCATFWTRSQRATYEGEVLRRYHATLDRPDYSFGALMHDYRIGIADWLLVPVQDAADGSARAYWLPKMRCLVEAFTDHGVAALFGG